ncbi:MAG TPA: group 1 truncated hemoglobin [Urbifossiella sp.]|jgi:hemoglobin
MRARHLIAASLFLAVLGFESVQGQEPPGPRKTPVEKAAAPAPLERWEIDQRACRTAYAAAKLGTDLWKEGDYKGTFRLYQGTLMGLGPMLDHRPRLAAFVREQLDVARGMESERGAFVLREALDAIQADTAEALMMVLPKKPALWERLGGEKNVKAIVHDFLAAAMKDPKVNFSRDGKYKLTEKQIASLEEHMVELISEISAGPLRYEGRHILKVHIDMKITDAEFDAFVGHVADSMKKYKVREKETEEILSYLKNAKVFIVVGK